MAGAPQASAPSPALLTEEAQEAEGEPGEEVKSGAGGAPGRGCCLTLGGSGQSGTRWRSPGGASCWPALAASSPERPQPRSSCAGGTLLPPPLPRLPVPAPEGGFFPPCRCRSPFPSAKGLQKLAHLGPQLARCLPGSILSWARPLPGNGSTGTDGPQLRSLLF